MKKNITIFSVFIFVTVILSGCSNRSTKLIGNVYTFQDDSLRFVAGFDQDTLFFTVKDMMNDSVKVAFHKSKYKINKVDDSTFIVEVEKKPKFWEKNTWEIVIENDNGLYTVGSKRHYKKSDDRNSLNK